MTYDKFSLPRGYYGPKVNAFSRFTYPRNPNPGRDKFSLPFHFES